MPLGASRLNFFTKPQEVAAEQRTAVTLTNYGDTQIDTAQSKFGGSSILFDGTGDAILATSALDITTGDFTIEAWVRPSSTTAQHTLTFSSPAFPGLTIYGTGNWKVYASSNGTSFDVFNGVDFGSVTANTWQHIAVVRSGNTYKGYVDGSETTIGTSATTLVSNGNVGVGGYFSGTTLGGNPYVNGHIDEVRVSNTARYTSGFTPSTTPFVNDANTQLLIHADGTDGDTVFIDDNGDRAPSDVRALNGATISTAQAKFGSSSFAFDGTDDQLAIENSNDKFSFTGDFTIEGWVYANSYGSANDIISNWTWGFNIVTLNGNEFRFRMTNSTNNGSVGVNVTGLTLATGSWYHFACVRSSGTATIYINGSSIGSASVGTHTIQASEYTGIGTNTDNRAVGSGIQHWNGYMDEIRISDTARYTSGFTAPTAPFNNDANTLLLLHAEEGANGTTEIFDDNGGTLP